MDRTRAPVADGLLRRRTDLLICSGCLKRGIRRPVVQVVSARHRLRTLCPGCQDRQAASRPPASAESRQ